MVEGVWSYMVEDDVKRPLFPVWLEETRRTLFCVVPYSPDSSQRCCIAFFKKPAAKVTCKSSLKKCGCQYCNANLPGETS